LCLSDVQQYSTDKYFKHQRSAEPNISRKFLKPIELLPEKNLASRTSAEKKSVSRSIVAKKFGSGV